jgi:hypothetical protein
MHPAGFELTILVSERPKTHASDAVSLLPTQKQRADVSEGLNIKKPNHSTDSQPSKYKSRNQLIKPTA